MKKLIILWLLFPFFSNAQNILKGANVIVVKNIGFLEVCNALLDSGYTIEKKDTDLQTVLTESRQYPKYYNATYKVNIRVKDSVAYISGMFTAPPGGGLFFNEPVTNNTNAKGVTRLKSLDGYIFILLNNFALAFKRETSYLTK